MQTQCPECNLMFTPENLQNELDAALMVIANLKAENARYRDALTFIAEGNIAQSSIWVNYIDEAYQQIAREALKGE